MSAALLIAAATPRSLTDVGIDWPTWEQVWRTLTFQAGFNASVVLLGTTLLGAAAGLIGAFSLLRKRALMGDALAHATLPGIALAFIVAALFGAAGKSLPVLLLGAAATGVVAIVCVQAISRYTRLQEDAAIGAVLSVFFGLGVVLLSVIQSMPGGDQGGLQTFIYGQTAAMRIVDASVIGGAAALCLLAALGLHKEFSLVCFDQDFASVQGWPVGWIDLLMMSLVVVVTVIGLQAVGLILIVAMLIVPAAAARFWTERLGFHVAGACVIGALSGYIGAAASALLPRLPAGSVIVLAAGVLFTISLLFAPARGVVAEGVRRGRTRARVARDHLLRRMLERERAEGRIDARRKIDLFARTRMGRLTGGALALWQRLAGNVRMRGGRLELTPEGRRLAERILRNHRLWEQYLIEYAAVAPTHTDFSADLVEHVLSPELVERLEKSLQGREAAA